MSNPYIGEIRMFGGNFAPAGWMFCQGQLLPISENDALFTLIGTTYGGDGQETFALPNLQGRLPVHMGQGPGIASNYILGESGGVEQVTLTVNQIPSHNHPMLATTNVSNAPVATGNLIGQSTKVDTFIDVNPTNAMNQGSIGPAGGSQPHDNLMPFLCISFIISLFGVYPTQS
jgi:microcystin-dependent protein